MPTCSGQVDPSHLGTKLRARTTPLQQHGARLHDTGTCDIEDSGSERTQKADFVETKTLCTSKEIISLTRNEDPE